VHRFRTGGAPDTEVLTEVARLVRRSDDPVAPEELKEAVGVSATRLTSAVNLLEQAGAIETTVAGDLLWQGGTVPRAVGQAEDIAESRRRVDRSRVDMMRSYAETLGCRRQFLLGYFGEELNEPCGACDTCRDGSAAEVAALADSHGDVGAAWPVGTRVRHDEWGSGSVVSEDGDRITVLFEQEGYRTLALAVVDEAGVLEPI
jgi:ATP-dependent DNA helicase RecQ